MSLSVLFVNRMAAMERGGGETFDLEIARHLQSQGSTISFLTGIPLFGGLRRKDLFSGFRSPVSSFHVRSPYFGWFPWDKVRGGWRLRVADFEMFEKVAARWILRYGVGYDVIQICELPNLVAWLKRGGFPKPLVMRVTAPNVYDPRGGMKQADAVIASGTSVEKLRATERPDCVEVPNGVDTDVFHPHESGFRRKAGLEADALIVLYVARFQAFKNHEVLLRAFAQMSGECARAVLLLAGSGPLEGRMKGLAAELGVRDRVRFLGEVPFGDLPDVYAAADIKVISSDYESFCFAAIEAMASGLPIVTTDCGWVPKLIEYGGGRVVPAGDASALAAVLCALAKDEPLRQEIGRRNRARAVEQHGWPLSARRLMDVYGSVCDVGEGKGEIG